MLLASDAADAVSRFSGAGFRDGMAGGAAVFGSILGLDSTMEAGVGATLRLRMRDEDGSTRKERDDDDDDPASIISVCGCCCCCGNGV